MKTYTGLISVIFTTYNSPAWLEKVLWGFSCQDDQNFEIIIADDGSTEETANLIREFSATSKIPIKHVWQADDGFQKCRIMNKALQEAKGDYVIFTDGDCIPRKDFVAEHRKNAEPGYFLSGGYFKLPMDISSKISQDDILKQNAFDVDWLVKNGLKKSFKLAKLSSTGVRQKILNRLTPTARTWNGHNASGWLKDLIAVNGFDETMQYGGQDCELGYRLSHSGLKTKQIRYTAIVVHLDHKRGYVSEEMLKKSDSIKRATLKSKRTYTPNGIVPGQCSTD